MSRPKKLGAGLVMLVAHVPRALRDHLRLKASSRGWTISKYIITVIELGEAVLEAKLRRDPDPSQAVTVRLTETERRFLDKLVSYGIYGSTQEEVVMRFIDSKLQEFAGAPVVAQEIPEFIGGARSRCPKTGRLE